MLKPFRTFVDDSRQKIQLLKNETNVNWGKKPIIHLQLTCIFRKIIDNIALKTEVNTHKNRKKR